MKRIDRERSPLERGGASLLAFVVVAVLVLDLLPAGRLVLTALAPDGVLAPDRALHVATSRSAVRATLATFETALASSGIALALGAAMALALRITDVRGGRAASFLFVLSTMISPQVVALAFLNVAGPASPLLNTLGLAPPPGHPNPMLGFGGIVLVLGLHHAPLVYVVLAAGLRRIPLALVDAARVDGANPVQIISYIVLPLLRPHLVGAWLLAFVAGAGNFGIPALLGLPVNYLTLPTLIYSRLSSFGPGVIADVAALGVLVAGVAGLGVLASGFVLRRESVRLEDEAPFRAFWTLGPMRIVGEALVWGLIGLVLAVPVLSLLTAALVPSYGMALTPATATAENFVEVLVRQEATTRAFANSLFYAGASAAILAVAVIPLAYVLVRGPKRWGAALSLFIELPYVLPGVVLAIACILVFARPLPILDVSLYGTRGIILFAYLARFLPVALKPAVAAMAQVERSQEEAAALDGAGLLRRLAQVVAPSLLPAAGAGGLLTFLLAFSELTVSALLWSAGTETVGVVLYSLEGAGLASQAAAVALVTVVVITAAMLALDAVGSRLPAGILPWRA